MAGFDFALCHAIPTPEDGAGAPGGLGDMPLAWLEKLLDTIASSLGGREQLLSLFRTCRVLRDLVASHRTLHITLQSPSTDVARLMLACRYFLNVHVAFKLSNEAAKEVLQRTKEELLGSLTAVKTVSLEQPCPTVSSIVLHHCNILLSQAHTTSNIQQDPTRVGMAASTDQTVITITQLPVKPSVQQGSSASTPAIQSLRRLHIGPNTLPRSGQDDQVTLWRHEFSVLTALDTLAVAAPLGAYTISIFQHLGPHLCHLHLMFYNPSPDFPFVFPNLSTLDIPSATITDHAMVTVLSLKHLTALGCLGFQLENDFSQLLPMQQPGGTAHCRWRTLMFQQLDIASCSRLPLANVRVLQAGGFSRDDLDLKPLALEHVDAADKVMQLMQRCDGVHCRSHDLWGWLDTEDGVAKARTARQWEQAQDELRLRVCIQAWAGMDEAAVKAVLQTAIACKPRVLLLQQCPLFKQVAARLLGGRDGHGLGSGINIVWSTD